MIIFNAMNRTCRLISQTLTAKDIKIECKEG